MKIAIIESFVFVEVDEETAATLMDSFDFARAVREGKPFRISAGSEEELKADWQEACARNNETRSFEAWLQDKAEALIN